MTTKAPSSFLTDYPFTVGLFIRLFLAWLLPLMLDDGYLIPGVAYTDIDYHVFTDAARYISQNESPFERHTYRYTPFLALILSKINGRIVFCVADAVCGLLILRMQQKRGSSSSKSLSSLFLWIYNPFAINICTRGSAESFVVLLPVLLTVTVTSSSASSGRSCNYRAVLAGFLHGIAVHAKLYPVIYSLTFMAYFARQQQQQNQPRTISSVSSFLSTWFGRLLLRPAPMLFAVTFLATFLGLTAAAAHFYGDIALQEGLLYHLGRVDHRHNYSMWWYPIYLSRLQPQGLGMLLTVGAQLILLIISSLGIQDLGLALYVQTHLFVTLNKVITAQYFTWYLCLLPLCIHAIPWSKALKRALTFLGVSIVTWLSSAYCLEMQGMPIYRIVWIASVIYFWANINLLLVIILTAKTESTSSVSKDE